MSHRALAALAAELGGADHAARRLLAIATDADKQIGVNAPTAGGSRTVVIGPRHWSQERLAGYVAPHHGELEGMFGPATVPATGRMTDRTNPERHPGAWLSRPTAQRACGHCGALFVLPRPSTRYCSPSCRGAVEEARRQRRKRPTSLEEDV